ncbi:MAG: ATP-binding protein [Cyclobacteriaceae bacterium]
MKARSVLMPIMVATLFGITILTSLIGYWIWADVKEKRFTDLENTISILNNYNELALHQRELALVSVGKQMLSINGENFEEGRLQVGRMALEIYDEFLAFGLTRTDGSMMTFTGDVETTSEPNLMNSPLTRRSFLHAKSGKRISIGEPYFFEQVNDWILPIRAPLFNSDTLVALNTSAIRYKSINDNLENFGFNQRYKIHAINTAFNTTQIYYPLEADQYASLLRKEADIYADYDIISEKNGIKRIRGFNTYENYPMIGVEIHSSDHDRSFIVSVEKGIITQSFWDRSQFIFLAWALLSATCYFGFNYLMKKDRKHKAELELYNRKLEEQVNDRTKELKSANVELQSANKDLNAVLTDLRDAQNQLVQSEKMASLGVLAAGVGHEINNPLNFIQGGLTALTELLNSGKPDPKEVSIYLEVIEEGVRRCTAITESLSHYSRQAGRMNEECDVESIIENCLLILGNRLKSKIKLHKHFSSEKVVVMGNEGKLHQVFLNILTNAEQAIKEKGEITIEYSVKNKEGIISIADTGMGIRKSDLNKISDPFFTTKGPKEGTGLGLSIAYSIIEEHGGTIMCVSKLNEGTEFIIKLPVRVKK